MLLRTLLAVSFALLAGCAGERSLRIAENIPAEATQRTVFVATSRAVDETAPGSFTGGRSETISYRRYSVSIPPTHRAGQIEWPRFEPDPATDFVVTGIASLDTSQSFARAVRNHGQIRGTTMLFVHGYNTDFPEALYRTAQIHHDFEATDSSVPFSWPSAGTPIGYGHDRDSILISRDALEDVLKTVARSGQKIALVGHSMGAHLVMETLRQMSISGDKSYRHWLDSVVLISPDIDVKLFKSQATAVVPLPEPFVVYTSRNDRALRISAGLSGQPERLGTISDIEELADLNITFIDDTQLSDGAALNHTVTFTSPNAIEVVRQMLDLREDQGASAQFAGNIFTESIEVVNNAVQLVLKPIGTASAKDK